MFVCKRNNNNKMAKYEGEVIDLKCNLIVELLDFVRSLESCDEIFVCEWFNWRFKHEAKINYEQVKIEAFNDAEYIKFKNLYSYVLACGICVPYHNWIYTDVFEYGNYVYLYDYDINLYRMKEVGTV